MGIIKFYNYYRILEVDPKASNEVIDKAYKALSLKYHPDRKSENRIEDKIIDMVIINDAYNTLKDKVRRSEYDKNFKKISFQVLLSEGIMGFIKLRRVKVIEIDTSWY